MVAATDRLDIGLGMRIARLARGTCRSFQHTWRIDMSKKFQPVSTLAAACLVIASGLAFAQTTDTTPRTDSTGASTGTTSGQTNPNSTSTSTTPGVGSNATGTTGSGTMSGSTDTTRSTTDTSRSSDGIGTMSDRTGSGFNADGTRMARRDRN